MSIIQVVGGGSEWPPSPAGDPNASNLILAMPFNSGYGIRDVSSKIRGSGSDYGLTNISTSVNTSASKFYGSSLLLGTSASRLATATGIPAFGTNNFTIEGWAFVPTLDPVHTLALFYHHNDTNAGFSIQLTNSGNAYPQTLFCGGGGGGDVNLASSYAFPLNAWTHFAVTRSGNTLRIFINGTNYTNIGGSMTNNYTFTGVVNFGNSISTTTYSTARFQDFRVYQGIAKYTSNFTPPGAMFI